MATFQPPPGPGAAPGSSAGWGPPSRITNRFAVAALVCGIIGLVLCPLTSIAAVVLAPLAKRQMAAHPDRYAGGRMAVTGQILGWLCIAVYVALGLFVTVLYVNSPR